MNKEFTSLTHYTLTFDYYTSTGNRNTIFFGFDPSIPDRAILNTSTENSGLAITQDIRTTIIDSWHDGNAELLYTHASNLFTAGTHSIKIIRNINNVSIHVDDVFLYTHNNCKYNTLGLWKWGGGYNSISNMDLII